MSEIVVMDAIGIVRPNKDRYFLSYHKPMWRLVFIGASSGKVCVVEDLDKKWLLEKHAQGLRLQTLPMEESSCK